MALILPNRYPGRAGSASSEYPQGNFKNRSAPNVEDGTYMEKDWLNDWYGFFGAILTAAGATPNGQVDTAQNSQMFDALGTIFPLKSALGTAAFKNIGTGADDVALSNTVIGGTYYNVTSSRVMGITYTNTATRPMLVIFSYHGTNWGTAEARVNSNIVARTVSMEFASSHSGPSLSFIVPPGSTYSVTKAYGTIGTIIWSEMV